MKPPCQACPNRSPTCHGNCERYAAYYAERREICQQNERDLNVLGVRIEHMRKRQMRKNTKKR